MKKQQKEKIKKGLLTSLHIIGYVCIGLTLITGIMVGVNSCNNTKQVNADNTLEISENVTKSLALDNFDLNSLNNFDYSQWIKTNANSVYYFNGQHGLSYGGGLAIKNMTTSYQSANCGLYVVNYSTNHVDYIVTSAFRLWGDGFEIVNSNNSVQLTIFLNTSDDYLFIFEDERLWYTDNVNNYYYPYNLFNDVLVYVGNTFSSENYGNEYLSLNYSTYSTFVSENWVNAGAHYLYPFVLPQELLSANLFCPVLTLNESDGGIKFVKYLSYTTIFGKAISFYYDNTSTPFFNILTEGYNQYLGYPSYYTYEGSSTVDPVLGYSFRTYCGCYKFGNFYKNFLSYSFEYDSTYGSYASYSVNTSLNYQFNAFTLYRMYDGDNNNGLTIFRGGTVNFDGLLTNAITITYSWPVWRIYYGWPSERIVENGSDPIVSVLVTYANYTQILDTLAYGYNPSVFTKLLGAYNPTGSEIPSTPTGDINSSGLGSAMDLIGKAFSSIASVLNLQIFGAFTLGSLVFIPLVVTIVLFIIKMFKR